MNEKISLKYIFKLILDNKKSLIIGQILTIIAIIISVPIPLLLPLLVDEVLLNKPDFFVNNINELFGNVSAFYYIAIVTFIVLFLRVIYFLFSVLITKIFTKISKYVTFKIREKLLNHLELVNTNEYESLGTGAIGANLVTDVNTLDNFIVSIASKFIASILTLLAVAIVIITIDPILGLMILFIQPIIMILSKKIANKTGLLKKEENKAIEEFQNNINETLDLFGQIKASNKEKFFFQDSISKASNIQKTSNEFNYKSVAYERFSFTIFLIAFEIFRAVGLILVAYSDLSIGLTSYERQYFYIRMGGDGIGLTNLYYYDAGNGGSSTSFRLNSIYVPPVGRGNWNYIYVMCTTSRSGIASLNVPANWSSFLYRAGDQPLYNA